MGTTTGQHNSSDGATRHAVAPDGGATPPEPPAARTVADILATRSDPTVHAISLDATVYEAGRLMTEKRISALIVRDGEAIAGIVTERDFTQKVLLGGRLPRDMKVREVMTSPIISVQPEQTVADCMLLMGKHGLRHLPVVVGGGLLGMISIRDFVNDIIASL